jgi:hypothetical protein
MTAQFPGLSLGTCISTKSARVIASIENNERQRLSVHHPTSVKF